MVKVDLTSNLISSFQSPDEDNDIVELMLQDNRISTLPDSFKNFKKLQTIRIDDNSLTEIPSSLFSITSLVKMYIQKNKIKSLPNYWNLPSLTYLNIGSNDLRDLPDSFTDAPLIDTIFFYSNSLIDLPDSLFTLQNLQKMQGYDNHLVRLPKTANLPELQSLVLYKNSIKEIPDSLGCKKLTYISIYENQLSSFPSSLFNCDKLVIISAYKNKITSLPDIVNMPYLEYMNFSSNLLTTLPNNFDKAPILRSVSFNSNLLTEIPSTLLNLPKLQTLNFINNKIKYFPDIIDLPKLKTLKVYNNSIYSLSNTFDHAPNLETVDFMNNSITIIPDTLFQLQSIKSINFTRNEIISLPEPNMPTLEQLVLKSNKLKNINYNFSTCSNLLVFSVCYNEIKYIDPAVFKHPNITIFLAEYNQLTSIPEIDLPYVSILSLFENKISKIGKIDKLLNLRELYLDGNELEELDDEFFSNPSVITINLSNNQLKKFPSIISLDNLNLFRLEGCGLKKLPDCFDSAPKLADLRLNDNLLEEIPITVMNHPSIEQLFLNNNSFTSLIRFNLPKLTRLDIYGNSISDFPEGLENSPELSYFNIKETNIVSIPNSLSKTSIKKLYAYNCPYLQNIPTNFNEWKELQLIYVYNCNLTKISPNIFAAPKINEVAIAENSHLYGEIPHSICNTSSLTILRFHGTYLSQFPNCTDYGYDGFYPKALSKLIASLVGFQGELPNTICNINTLYIYLYIYLYI